MNARIPIVMIVLAGLSVSEPADAKGRTIQLTITGPGLESPLHSSENSLTSASVWGGGYIDWETGPIDKAVGESPVYLVHFWVQLPRGPIQMKYIVGYRWDDESSRAIICIPGERNPWYSVNVSSIIRGNEGSCYFAEETWGKAVKSVLASAE